MSGGGSKGKHHIFLGHLLGYLFCTHIVADEHDVFSFVLAKTCFLSSVRYFLFHPPIFLSREELRPVRLETDCLPDYSRAHPRRIPNISYRSLLFYFFNISVILEKSSFASLNMCSDAEPSALVFVYPNFAKSRVLEEFLYFIIAVYCHAVYYFRPFVVFFVVPAAFVADHEHAA